MTLLLLALRMLVKTGHLAWLRPALLAAVLLVAAVVPALAEHPWGAWLASAPRSANIRIPALVDSSIRRAAPGTENVVALLGGSEDGSDEERYARNFNQQVGGRYLHGGYGLGDLVETLLPADRASRPLSNLYFAGHMVSVPREQFPRATPAQPDDPYLGFLIAGRQEADNVMNLDNQFFNRYDARMRELGLTPADVWAPNSQIVFKPCGTARYSREFLDQFAERVPESTTIEAYSTPYTWESHTQYPFGIRTGEVHRMARQEEGLVLMRGRWKPEPVSQTAEAPAAAIEATAEPEAPMNPGESEDAVDLSD